MAASWLEAFVSNNYSWDVVFSMPGESIQWEICSFLTLQWYCKVTLSASSFHWTVTPRCTDSLAALFISNSISILIFTSVSRRLARKSLWQFAFPAFYSPERSILRAPQTKALQQSRSELHASLSCHLLPHVPAGQIQKIFAPFLVLPE